MVRRNAYCMTTYFPPYIQESQMARISGSFPDSLVIIGPIGPRPLPRKPRVRVSAADGQCGVGTGRFWHPAHRGRWGRFKQHIWLTHGRRRKSNSFYGSLQINRWLTTKLRSSPLISEFMQSPPGPRKSRSVPLWVYAFPYARASKLNLQKCRLYIIT